MIRIIALDDEPPALDIVETFCRRLPNVQLMGKFTRTGDALARLGEEDVDLLLLDINMPAVSGIDFYKGLPHKLMVIFITSYSEYAVESYNVNAVDYLLKPFTFDRFQQAIEKAILHLELSKHYDSIPQKQLVLRMDYGLIKIAIGDILVVESLDNYMKIHLHGQKPLTVRTTMKALLDKLPPNEFVRVHRSYIVALSRIENVRRKIISIAGMEIPISSSYEEDFNNLFQ
jgi:DNA-binding LytR/AlgR family response regulator